MASLLPFCFLALGLLHYSSAASKCNCYLDIITENERDRIYSTTAPFSGSCSDNSGCSKGCYNYANKLTHGGDLSWRPVGNSGPTIGDFACGFIGGTLPKSTIEGFSKACDNDEVPVDIKVKQDFCCIDNVWPNGKCDDV